MFSGSIFSEKRMVFWIETGDPVIDRTTVAIIAEKRARLLVKAKAGEEGVVDGDDVRVLRAAAKFAAVVAGKIPADEIPVEEAGDVRGEEPAKVLPFKADK